MGKRRKAREIVLQALYEREFSELPGGEILANQVDRRASTEVTVHYASELFEKVLQNIEELDRKIRSAVENWDIDRLSLVDRNILRFALAEILYCPQVPSKVILNEAIEIAHKYSSADAGQFINGVLDRFVHQYRREAV